jgi:hypothetical protein
MGEELARLNPPKNGAARPRLSVSGSLNKTHGCDPRAPLNMSLSMPTNPTEHKMRPAGPALEARRQASVSSSSLAPGLLATAIVA